MGMVPSGGDSADRFINHGKRLQFQEIRRSPAASGVDVPIPALIPAESIGVDWLAASSDPSHGLTPMVYKYAGRVWLSGVIEYQGANASRFPLINCPSEYAPLYQAFNCVVHTDYDNTGVSTHNLYWSGEIVSGDTPGSSWLELDQNDVFAGSPLFGGCPAGTFIVLDGISYRHA